MFRCNCPHEVRSGCTEPACPHFEKAPHGFKSIDSAPKDGTFIRLRFRPGLGRETWEAIGGWRGCDEMPAGGWWFDRNGYYVIPGPLFWAPEHGSVQ